ncbi:HNH endonuclease [Thermaurantiacus sp.]
MSRAALRAEAARTAIAAVLFDLACHAPARAEAQKRREMEAAWEARERDSLSIREQRRRWLDELRASQGDRCAYCGCRFEEGTPRRATIDHVVALARGGPDTKANCVAACHRCNELKRDMDAELFRAWRPWLAGETPEPPPRLPRPSARAGGPAPPGRQRALATLAARAPFSRGAGR